MRNETVLEPHNTLPIADLPPHYTAVTLSVKARHSVAYVCQIGNFSSNVMQQNDNESGQNVLLYCHYAVFVCLKGPQFDALQLTGSV